MKQSVPKSQRLTLALVGKTNAGKSTLLNLIAGQPVAITSHIAGTTTDVVEQAMELRPFGPVLWLDTGGWDDATALGEARKERTAKALARADIIIGVEAATHATKPPRTRGQSARVGQSALSLRQDAQAMRTLARAAISSGICRASCSQRQ